MRGRLVALIAVGIGIGLGLINGLLVAVGRIPSIIATLATLGIYRGIDTEITGGKNITAYQLPDRFLRIASTKPAGVPTLAWIALGVALVGAAVVRWAPFARDFGTSTQLPADARLLPLQRLSTGSAHDPGGRP